MKRYNWNDEKSKELKKTRKISFEEVVIYIESGAVMDIVENPNREKYAGQKVYVLNINNYAYLVPFAENEREIFLKTIIPSRKATKKYLKGGNK